MLLKGVIAITINNYVERWNNVSRFSSDTWYTFDEYKPVSVNFLERIWCNFIIFFNRMIYLNLRQQIGPL